MTAPRRWLTPAETADMIGASRVTVYRLIRRHQIPAFKLAGICRVDREGLTALLEGAAARPGKKSGR